MANEKISQLTPGGPAQSTDLLPIARSGANFSLTAAPIAGTGTTPTTVTQTGAVSTTSVTLTMTSVAANDVIQFGCIGY